MNFNNLPVAAVLSAVGERLRRARLDGNLTQRELAEAVGVSLKTVRNAEDGQNISLETLVRLLQGLGRADELERVLDADGPSPIELAERLGKQRQRATGRRVTDPDTAGDWEW